MAHLLAKLRIDYSSLIMLQGITEKPKESTIRMHNILLDGFREGQNDECFVSDTELEQLRDKTERQLRLREMLLEHSKNATMIAMSMPVPRKVIFRLHYFCGEFSLQNFEFQGSVSAPLYMSWLEMLTRDMPPFLLVRGNQASVLTFYS